MTRHLARRHRALAGAGGLLLLSSAAVAQGEPGSTFGSYVLLANAPGIGLDGLYPDVAFTVPEVTSSLATGAVGAGLSSLAWPGPVLGNAGSTILVLSPEAPPEAVLLNSPVRAEARTGGEAAATNTTVPGTLMTSTAEPDEVTAQASTGESTVLPMLTSGVMASSSRVVLTEAGTAVAEAETSVARLSFADGAVAIGSVTSAALATSDGVTASAEGATTVTGMTIAGVPVVVDGEGVRVADTQVDNPVTTAAVNEAVQALGLTVLLTEPRTTVDGGSVTYDAGALVLLFSQDGSDYALTLGRASVSVAASPSLDVGAPAPSEPLPTAPPTSGVSVPPPLDLVGGFTSPPLTSPSLTSPSLPLPATDLPAVAPVVPEVAGSRSVVPVSFSLAGGVPSLLALLGLGAVALAATGLRRLPARLLAVPAVECDERQT